MFPLFIQAALGFGGIFYSSLSATPNSGADGDAGTVTAEWQLANNGTLNIKTGTPPYNFAFIRNWITPPESATQIEHWVKFEQTSGDTLTTGTLSSWLKVSGPSSASRSLSYSVSSRVILAGVFTAELATDAAGVTVVASGGANITCDGTVV